MARDYHYLDPTLNLDRNKQLFRECVLKFAPAKQSPYSCEERRRAMRTLHYEYAVILSEASAYKREVEIESYRLSTPEIVFLSAETRPDEPTLNFWEKKFKINFYKNVSQHLRTEAIFAALSNNFNSLNKARLGVDYSFISSSNTIVGTIQLISSKLRVYTSIELFYRSTKSSEEDSSLPQNNFKQSL